MKRHWASLGAACAGLMLMGTPHAATPAAVSADAVVAAERAFAAAGQEYGWVAAFKRTAAPDAVVFQPDVINAQDAFAKLPDDPPDRSLKWWPVWAGIAASGDLGFTTGPFTVGEDKGFGHYFTVWQKQRDGAWRWIYDGGPRNAAKSALGPATEPAVLPAAAAGSGAAAWAEVAAAEAALAAAAAQDAKTAYLAHLAADARVMGSAEQPAVGRAAYGAELDRRPAVLDLKPLGGKASAAGDLVFTYGEARWTQDGAPGSGHYVRIWQKRQAGWSLVFDELLSAPPKKPS